MKKDNEHIDNLIIEFLSDSLSDTERDELTRWMSQSEANRHHFRQFEQLWQSAVSREELDRFDTSKAFAAFIDRVSAVRRQSRMRVVRYAIGATASLLLVIGIAYGSFLRGRQDIVSSLGETEITTPDGSSMTMTLPDGTRVRLNAGSRMACSQTFGIKDRTVLLNGQAYFDVSKDKAKPFFVKSENMTVEVTGTRFGFRDYSDDKSAEVVLEKGHVNVSSNLQQGEVKSIIAGHSAIIDKATGNIRVTVSPKHFRQCSKDRVLRFEGETLAAIARDIERQFGVSVEINNPKARHLRFVGEFATDSQSVTDVLDALTCTGKISYKMNGNKITIY